MNCRLMQWIFLTPLMVACGGGGKTSESEGSTTAQTATDASTGPGGTTTVTSSGTSGGGASNSGTSSGDPTTSGSTGGSSSGPGETTKGETTKGETSIGETTDAETTKGETSKGETTDADTTKGETTKGETTKGETTGGETGNLCVDMQGSCANGEMCCPGLECCAGVPVPPGKEFCSNNCPISDRNMKTDFRAVDPEDVLRRVAALEISTWRYKQDGPEVRHLGPMAQDFKQAFGLWDTDRMIFPLDATGVSMAAIQALHRRVVEAEEENTALRSRLDRLERRLAELDR